MSSKIELSGYYKMTKTYNNISKLVWISMNDSTMIPINPDRSWVKPLLQQLCEKHMFTIYEYLKTRKEDILINFDFWSDFTIGFNHEHWIIWESGRLFDNEIIETPLFTISFHEFNYTMEYTTVKWVK